MAKPNVRPQSVTKQAKVRTLQSFRNESPEQRRAVIPQEVQQDIISLILLTRRMHEMLAGIEYRLNSIVKKLTGVKVDDALLADLVAEHNQRAAKLRGGAAVRS